MQSSASDWGAGCDGGHGAASGELGRLQGEVQGSSHLPGLGAASAGVTIPILCLLLD